MATTDNENKKPLHQPNSEPLQRPIKPDIEKGQKSGTEHTRGLAPNSRPAKPKK